MKRGARSAPAVSLFPFLAVLVCAMGALILLLLVTTRRIRDQREMEAVHRAHAGAMLADDHAPGLRAAQVSVGPSRGTAMRPEDLLPIEPLLAVDPAPALPPLPPPPTVSPRLPAPRLSLPLPPAVIPVDPNAPWRERLDRLTAAHTTLREHLHRAADQLRKEQDLQQQQERELQAAAELTGRIAAEKGALETRFTSLQGQQTLTNERLAGLRRQIDETHEQIASADSKFAIIPYDGRVGSTRRPIFIECTAAGVTFVSEGVTLRTTDLNGFTTRLNPLLQGVRVLERYWQLADRQTAVRGETPGEAPPTGDPYVLLVVRPDGILSFYVARMLLSQLNEPFGYELVLADQEFAWPPVDPEAARLLRSVIESMLRDRAELLARLKSAIEDEPAGSGAPDDEVLRLEEIDLARPSGREVTINGRRYSREPTSPESLSTDGSSAVSRGPEQGSGTGDGFFESLSSRRSRPLDAAPSQLSTTPTTVDAGRSTLNSPQTGPPRSSADQNAADPGRSRVRAPQSMSDVPPSPAGMPRDAAPLPAHRSGAPPTLGLAPGDSANRPTRGSTDSAAERPSWSGGIPGGMIGFEREIHVQVMSTRIVVADETTFPITDGILADELTALMAAHVDQHIRSWGAAPNGFTWIPTFRFVVSPGGNQYSERLIGVVHRWGLQANVEFTLE
jgi:hypothetical protein